jgi:hypothetical protein
MVLRVMIIFRMTATIMIQTILRDVNSTVAMLCHLRTPMRHEEKEGKVELTERLSH